jgi:hypothetical protein
MNINFVLAIASMEKWSLKMHSLFTKRRKLFFNLRTLCIITEVLFGMIEVESFDHQLYDYKNQTQAQLMSNS